MENKHKQFKPYDRVLVREGKKWPWRATFYSHFNPITYHHYTTSGAPINDILPYEGNEGLVGTTDEPDEEVKLEEGEWMMCSIAGSSFTPFDYEFGKFVNIENEHNYIRIQHYNEIRHAYLFIRFSDFNPSDMEETRKHILHIKNGKLVKYKE